MNTAIRKTNSLPLILRLLMPKHGIDPDRIEALREAQVKENVPIEELLIRKSIATEREIADIYADYYMFPLFEGDVGIKDVNPQLSRVLSEKLCRDHNIAPVSMDESSLTIAFFTPSELLLVEELQLITGRDIRPMFATLSTIENILMVLYSETSWSGDTTTTATGVADFEEVDEWTGRDQDPDDESAEEQVVHLDQLPPPGRDGRVIRYVNQVFEQALAAEASDIHIEPLEDRCRIRLRVDGRLAEISPPPKSLFTPVVSRIKVLAKMDIAEKRLPQDGAIALRAADRRVDLRVNTCPTVHGEKIVMRVLDKNSIRLEITDLGPDERQARDLLESIKAPHGLLLVTGPTGSGKSTTLYSCLNQLNKTDTNICTVEDPVEYKLDGVNQVQTKSQVGLDFKSALRAFLRQDPDVIMVGEVRDGETAEICLRAALTGHFVLSTLHTNDALAAVTRLEEMGVEPFLLSSTLRAVVAQRLIRRLCVNCREPFQLESETANRVGIQPDETIFRPVGCNECRNAGYKGRVGIFEVIRINNKIANLIQRKADVSEMREEAVSQGMKLLFHSAMDKVRAGQTSLEEALSVTISEENGEEE